MTAYADRYGSGPSLKPGSLGLALGMTALPIVALVLGLQITHTTDIPKIFNGTSIPLDPPPPPDPVKVPPKPETKLPADPPIFAPPIKPPVASENPIPTTPDLPITPPPTGPVIPEGTGTGTVITPPKPPVTINAIIDPRYQGLLQPPYPPEEQRAGNSGRVQVRVLIGTDGRVKQVERISAASDAFFAATQRQALNKWRFKPATKDGVPIEQWKVMSLSFVLNDG